MANYSELLVVILQLLCLCCLPFVSADCPDPEVPKDGSRSSPKKHQFKTGEVIHYYCKANYTLEGPPKVLCLASGNWDMKPPKCNDPCGTCQNNGKCVYDSSVTKFYCLCTPEYRGNQCTIPRCKPPNAVYYGGYNGFPPVDKPLYDIGTVVKFYCDEGYRIAGSYSEVKCILGSDRTAKWSRAFPVCKVRTCKFTLSRSQFSNGRFTPNKKEFSIGETIEFSCSSGFRLRGGTTYTCTSSGLWSTVSWPRCVAKKCPYPPPLVHGRIIQKTADHHAGSFIRFQCLSGKGYYLYGQDRQTCISNSNGDMIWHPARPQCITRSLYEQYCALQRKVFTLEPDPKCVSPSQKYSNGDKSTSTRNASIDTLTIVTGTAGGLLGFLLVIIAFVIYQRRKLMRRMRRATSRRNRSYDDARMLIYCSHDFHFILPTYDEAINSRSSQPPSFEDVPTSREQNQESPNQGTTPNIQGIDENTTSSQDTTEGDYETIENMQNYINSENIDRQRDEENTAANDNDESTVDPTRTFRTSSEESIAEENHPLV